MVNKRESLHVRRVFTGIVFFASAALIGPPAGRPGGQVQQQQQTKRPEQAVRQMAPDLKIVAIDLWVCNPGETDYASGRPITTDSLVRLLVYFRNAGLVPISMKNVCWRVIEGPIRDGKAIATPDVLAAGAEDSSALSYFGPGKLAPGKYTIKVEVDSTHILPEIDRTNNVLAKTFDVSPSSRYSGLPDLRVSEARAELVSTCGRTRSYRITATVANEGTAPAFVARGGEALRIEPSLASTPSVGAGVHLPPKESLTLTYETSLRAGESAKFLFTTDRSNEVKESNEGNNTRVLAVSAPPISAAEKGDLVVEEAHVEFTTSNQRYWLVVALRNRGPGPLALCRNMVVWRLVDPPAGLGWTGSVAAARSLKAGETYEPSETAHDRMPAGAYTFTIKVDPDDLFEEADETNNLFTLRVRVPEDVRRK